MEMHAHGQSDHSSPREAGRVQDVQLRLGADLGQRLCVACALCVLRVLRGLQGYT